MTAGTGPDLAGAAGRRRRDGGAHAGRDADRGAADPGADRRGRGNRPDPLPPVSLGPPGSASARLPRSVLEHGEDVRLIPVRVAWLPEEHAGRRAARLHDILPGHDPYHPSERQQQRILARQPGRATVLVGEPATVASLRQRWADTTGGEDPDDFAAYVARRATLALDRAEYRLLGPRYKTPSLVKEEILSSRRFRSGLSAGAARPRGTRRRWPKPARSSTSSPPAGAAGSSTSCRPSGG